MEARAVAGSGDGEGRGGLMFLLDRFRKPTSDDRDQLRAALNRLGNTEREVADFLAASKIKGVRFVSDLCPIAVYLKSCGFRHVDVTGGCVLLNRISDGRRVPTPKAVDEFVSRFDDGHYPALEK